MKIYNDLVQGSDEWFAVRLGKLTASKAQQIGNGLSKTGKIGAGLETLCFEKVAEILSGTREEGYKNPDMERGNEQETLARSAYELENNADVKTVGFIELDERVGCSPDGLVGDDGLVEIKCHNNLNFTKLLFSKKIETKYIWQMQMQMYIAERKWCDYVAFNENFENLITIRVERDEEAISKIVEGIELGKARINEILEGCK